MREKVLRSTTVMFRKFCFFTVTVSCFFLGLPMVMVTFSSISFSGRYLSTLRTHWMAALRDFAVLSLSTSAAASSSSSNAALTIPALKLPNKESAQASAPTATSSSLFTVTKVNCKRRKGRKDSVYGRIRKWCLCFRRWNCLIRKAHKRLHLLLHHVDYLHENRMEE